MLIKWLFKIIYRRIIKKYNYIYIKYDPYYNPEYIDTSLGEH